MAIYQFECKVCERSHEFTMKMDDVPRVGESQGFSRTMVNDADFVCSCGANNWTRVWPAKTGGFRINMRRTSVL